MPDGCLLSYSRRLSHASSLQCLAGAMHPHMRVYQLITMAAQALLRYCVLVLSEAQTTWLHMLRCPCSALVQYLKSRWSALHSPIRTYGLSEVRIICTVLYLWFGRRPYPRLMRDTLFLGIAVPLQSGRRRYTRLKRVHMLYAKVTPIVWTRSIYMPLAAYPGPAKSSPTPTSLLVAISRQHGSRRTA